MQRTTTGALVLTVMIATAAGLGGGGCSDSTLGGGTAGAGGATMAAGTTGTAGATRMAGATGMAGSAGSAPIAGRGGVGGSAGTGGAREIVVCPYETDPPVALADSCQMCLDANQNPAWDGCCKLTDQVGAALCQRASTCMREGQCNVYGDVSSCYCGAHLATCQEPGEPNGPCVREMAEAAGRNLVTMTTDMPDEQNVLARSGDPRYALGRAANIHQIAGTFCPMECGL